MANNNHILLFLGSGATKGSGIKRNAQELPTDNEFFDKNRGVPAIIHDWEKGYPALKLCREKIRATKSTSLYQTWNKLFIFRGLAQAGIVREEQKTLHEFNNLENHNWSPKYKWRKEHYRSQFLLMNQGRPVEYFLAELAIWDLRTLVKDMYGDIGNSLGFHKKGSYKKFCDEVKKKLQSNEQPSEIAAVVNLNYDTTFDDANVVQYYYPGDGNSKENKIPIIRPHGSLKWTSRSGWRLDQSWTGWTADYEETELKDMGYKATNNPDLLKFKQPLIVTPADFKEEVVGNSSMPGLQNPILRQQWKHLNQALKEYNHWVFVGTSFASGDDHLLWLLKSSYRKCETKISCFIKDNCQSVWNLNEGLGCEIKDINVYKIKNDSIDKFELFNQCEKQKCNHSS